MSGTVIMEALGAIGLILEMIVLVPLFIILLIISLLIPPTVDTDISQYETYRQELNYAVDFMPTLDSLGEFEELRFGYQETPDFFLQPQTLALTVKYKVDDYTQIKNTALQSTDFLDAPLLQQDGDCELDNAFSYQGFDFNCFPIDDTSTYQACKEFLMFGTNDTLHCIAWLYFVDTDIDCIAAEGEDADAEMRELIDDYFHWKPFAE